MSCLITVTELWYLCCSIMVLTYSFWICLGL